MTFICSTCGETHDLSQISFGADAPFQWGLLTSEDKKQSELGSEQCIINTKDDTHYFVRANLEIPIKSTTTRFRWGVWVSLSETSFLEMSENWNNPERTGYGPYFGWLCTKIPNYPDTLSLKTMVYERAIGTRPEIVLEPTEHLLSLHQQDGISQDDLQNLITTILHESP